MKKLVLSLSVLLAFVLAACGTATVPQVVSSAPMKEEQNCNKLVKLIEETMNGMPLPKDVIASHTKVRLIHCLQPDRVAHIAALIQIKFVDEKTDKIICGTMLIEAIVIRTAIPPYYKATEVIQAVVGELEECGRAI